MKSKHPPGSTEASPNSITAPLGHDAQRTRFRRLILADRFPHATLLAGPAGIGKYLVAQELARTLLCAERSSEGAPCESCKSCRAAIARIHPDIHLIDLTDDEQGAVEAVREQLSSLALHAFAGLIRVLIIRDADRMSLQVANALLKTLEEPRPNTYFILTSSNSAQLPPTIRSRTQVWFFDCLSLDVVAAVLEARGVQASAARLRAELLDGSLDYIDLVSGGDSPEKEELWRGIQQGLESAASGESTPLLALIAAGGRDRGKVSNLIHLLRLGVRRAMRSAPNSRLERRWALALSDLLFLEYLIIDRHVAPQGALTYWALLLSPRATPDSFTAFEQSATLLAHSLP